MKNKIKEKSYRIIPGVIPKEKFEEVYDQLPLCESLIDDISIRHSGLKSGGKYSLSFLIDSNRWFIPRDKVSFFNEEVIIVRRDFAEEIGLLKK